MKSLTSKLLNIVVQMIDDCYTYLRHEYPEHVRDLDRFRDVAYITQRSEAEGYRFFTVALPKLGEWLDEIFATGHLPEQRVDGFKPYDGLFPCFLRPFWAVILTLEDVDGGLTSPPDSSLGREKLEMIARLYRMLRSLCYAFKKLETELCPEEVAFKEQVFLEIEDDLTMQSYPVRANFSMMQTIANEILRGFADDRNAVREEMRELVRHGPGAVADARKREMKWIPKDLFLSVHSRFPYYDYFLNSVEEVDDRAGHRYLPLMLARNAKLYKNMTLHESPSSRMIAVPKDSRGPRLIAAEPAELMYLQQGYASRLVKRLETCCLTKGHINFDDQTVNQELALAGSEYRTWATIDLSDASDRVSLDLVKGIFGYNREFLNDILALRSTHTTLPNGEVVPLLKYATMGSALCFPVESLVFFIVSVGALVSSANLSICEACDSVYVFGDDIIVKDKYAGLVMEALQDVGLAVNKRKSFYGESWFRESCGVDAWKGMNVTPFRIKKTPPRRPSDATSIVAYVKYSDNMYECFPRTAIFLLEQVERIIGRLLRLPYDGGFIHSSIPPFSLPSVERRCKWSKDLQSYTSKEFVVTTKPRASNLPEDIRILPALSTQDPDLWWEPEPFCSVADVVDRQSTQIRRRRVIVR